jgi:formate hydrogenlyase transcriptional activator
VAETKTHADSLFAGRVSETIRRLLETVPDAMLIADLKGGIVLANTKAERLFGYAPKELLGQSVEVLVPESLRQKHVQHRQDFRSQPRARPMGSGWELFGRRKDGSVFPIEISLSPTEDADGFFVSASIRDISDRKKAQEALRLSEERFRTLVAEVKDYAIFMLDIEGRVLTWNDGAARFKGYTRDEIVGQHFSRFYTLEDIEHGKPEESLKIATEKGRWEDEGWRVRKDGSRFWASVVITPLRGEDGKLLGFAKVTRDITEQKQSRDAFLLEMTNALVSSLNIHQLLRAISSCLHGIKKFDFASIAVYDPETKMLKREALEDETYGGSPEDLLLSPAGDSPAAWVFNTRRPLLFEGKPNEKFPHTMPPAAAEHVIRSGCWLPLVGREGMLGTLNLLSRSAGTFGEGDLIPLGQIANQIAIALDNALAYQRVSQQKERLAEEKLYLQDEIRTEHNFEEIVGQSRAIRKVLKQIETVAPTDSTVLILGETGTGKELLARAVHNLSPRHGKTFVRVNCASIPSGLLESELFGHEKGAFTGAINQRIGRLELANQGTLFLDEVGDIPLDVQAKLLRALQEKEFERLGSSRTLTSDARIIAATNRDLKKMAAAGEFRRDLYYRLNVFPVAVPPLRERKEDIALLAQYFLAKYSKRMKKGIESVAPEAMQALSNYGWPGNIRELEHMIERAIILTSGNTLRLPPFEVDEEPAEGGASSLQNVEREHILRVLRKAGGKIAGPGGAAEQLGMNRTTLNSRMQKLRISRKDI